MKQILIEGIILWLKLSCTVNIEWSMSFFEFEIEKSSVQFYKKIKLEIIIVLSKPLENIKTL